MSRCRTPLLVVVLACCSAAPAAAAELFPTTPDWESADTLISTGATAVDLNRDGWLDLVVANGNDMAAQPLVVYYNTGAGGYPAIPDWSSDDLAYNGHLDVADVNGDGWPDVAVAVLGTSEVIDRAAKLYLNSDGILSSTPDWQTIAHANAFSCAFGDVNNDGRPDLAVGTGWAYGSPAQQHFARNLVYVNIGGSLPTSYSWRSDDSDHLQGVLWVDADRDGWLDLAAAPAFNQTSIYRNLGGDLETTASWHTEDAASQDAIMLATGDLDGDGRPELLVTDNTQLGGSGLLRAYAGNAEGLFAPTFSWSTFADYGSAVAVADLNDDGRLDVVSGGWWSVVELFLNRGEGPGVAPDWIGAPITVVEKIVAADVDNDFLSVVTERFADAGSGLLELSRQPVHGIVEVRAGAAALPPDRYCVNPCNGWVSVAARDVSVTVTYVVSRDVDLIVTNWDDDVGNQLYLNRSDRLVFQDGFETGDTAAW